jgi:hypothetical protein
MIVSKTKHNSEEVVAFEAQHMQWWSGSII